MAVCAQSTVLRTREKHSKTPKYQSSNRGTPDHDPSPSSSSPRCTDAAKADDNGKPLEGDNNSFFFLARHVSLDKQTKQTPTKCLQELVTLAFGTALHPPKRHESLVPRLDRSPRTAVNQSEDVTSDSTSNFGIPSDVVRFYSNNPRHPTPRSRVSLPTISSSLL